MQTARFQRESYSWIHIHGKKGNMKLAKGCSWCKYKYDCYKDSNDGQGLRTFQYSKGLTYLTGVVVEPNVEELL